MPFENRNYAFAGAFVDELARCGLRHACVCPGSRSSPLTISFARHPAIRTWVHLDERSASFFALGIARALGGPVAVVCTSGTAAANLYPAVAEARHARVPLLLLTSDRPPEAAEWGAPQAMDQVRLYGSHAKWSVNMPPPETTTALMAFVRSTACRAYSAAIASPSGPVHVNFPFREPLEPAVVPGDAPGEAAGMADEAWRGREGGRPFISVAMPDRDPRPADVGRLTPELASTERGVIVCGPQPDPRLAKAVATLSRRLRYPVLADPLSQVRCGPHDRTMVIDSYDAFLRDTGVAASLAPEVVLRFGAVPTSKPLTRYLEQHRVARHILVDGGEGWRDPFHLTGEVVHADAVAFCTSTARAIPDGRAAQWADHWCSVAEAARAAMHQEMETLPRMFEGKVFSELADLVPNGTTLFAGNSMPVRDMDTFFPSLPKRVRFLANRGVNGIDGVVSSALGASAVSRGKLVLVVGDISFYHDMNGLLASRLHRLDATLIVINNDGGGIFSFLPQAAHEEVFEPYFGTPHGLTFRAAAELYGLGYRRAEDWRRFREAVSESLTGTGTTIVEVPGDRASNVTLHRRVWERVAASVQVGTRG